MKLHKLSLFVGAISIAAIFAMLGARGPSTESPKKFDAYIGIGGFQVIDHSSNTLYLYDVNPIFDSDDEKKIMKLLGTIDINKAGNEQLSFNEGEKQK